MPKILRRLLDHFEARRLLVVSIVSMNPGNPGMIADASCGVLNCVSAAFYLDRAEDFNLVTRDHRGYYYMTPHGSRYLAEHGVK